MVVGSGSSTSISMSITFCITVGIAVIGWPLTVGGCYPCCLTHVCIRCACTACIELCTNTCSLACLLFLFPPPSPTLFFLPPHQSTIDNPQSSTRTHRELFAFLTQQQILPRLLPQYHITSHRRQISLSTLFQPRLTSHISSLCNSSHLINSCLVLFCPGFA